ncbi:DUF4352 domain-containing protein [Micromonospora rubida]
MTAPGQPNQHQPYPNPPIAGPPPYGPPPTPGATAPAPRQRPAWLVPTLLGVGAMVAICCGIGMAGALLGDSKPASESTSSKAPAAEPARTDTTPEPAAAKTSAAPKKTTAPSPAGPKSYGVGDKVRGGDFEFTVNGVKCGISQVGDSFLNHKAQGSFCRVNITVKNVTKSAHLFHADGTVTAEDAAGRTFDADGEAAIYGNDNAKGFLDEINPGNSVRANVFFDVPKGTKLKTVTFDAGLFTFASDAVVTL